MTDMNNLEDAGCSENGSRAESDFVNCNLGEEESREFQELNPEVKDEELWEPPTFIAKFLDKHFIMHR